MNKFKIDHSRVFYEIKFYLADSCRDYTSVINLEDVEPESDIIKDLGLDQIDKVDLSLFVEEIFEIEFDDEEFHKVKTVDQLVNLTLKTLEKENA